jgi:putative DNA primase/helicase
MCRAAARYARPGLDARVAWAPAGADFDDLWRTAADDAGRQAAAEQILAILGAAAAPIAPEIAGAKESKPRARARADEAPAARASDSEPGARQAQTGAGVAGAPIGLHLASSGPGSGNLPDNDDAEIEAAIGPAPPFVAPPARALSAQNKEPSRMGTSGIGAGGMGRDGKPELSGDELNRALAFYAQTDLGNAERMADRFWRRLKYSPAHGWLAWNGKAYSPEEGKAQIKLAEHDTVRGIQDEAKAIEAHAGGFVPRITHDRSTADGKVVDLVAKRDRRKVAKELKAKREDLIKLAAGLRAFGRKSESRPRLAAIGDRAEAYLSVPPNKLDADPFKINVANGTLVVRRDWSREGPEAAQWQIVNEFIRFKPHDPADLITKTAPVDFDPDAECPLYDEFLAYVQPVEENRRHLHQCGGLCLTGDISEQVMWFNWGKGKNGKSTLFNAWAHVVGDYGRSVAIETFLAAGTTRNGAQASPDLARLAGVRMVRTSEPERGAKLAEALIKLATGGEPMTVRHLNKDVFELLPCFKMVMAGNYRPEIRGTDEGIWRRIKLVPWTVSIPEEKRDRDFGDKLKAEGSGILNRLLEGLVDWLKHGLTTPKDVKEATAEYRKDSDPLGRFLDACVVTKEGAKEQSSGVHQVFCAWCRANGEKEWTATGFGKAMAERGFQRKHSDVNWWLNIELTKSVADFAGSNEPPPHGEPIAHDTRKQVTGNAQIGPIDDEDPF